MYESETSISDSVRMNARTRADLTFWNADEGNDGDVNDGRGYTCLPACTARQDAYTITALEKQW
jgi:hypothetical protein